MDLVRLIIPVETGQQLVGGEVTGKRFQRFLPVEEYDGVLASGQQIPARVGKSVVSRSKKKTHSVEADPLVPALKLSTKRTVLSSIGTVVPPDCKGPVD